MILTKRDVEIIKKGMHPKYIWRQKSIIWENPINKALIGKLQ